MLHVTDFAKRIANDCQKIQKESKVILTKFLNAAEIEEAKGIANYYSVPIHFYGGYEMAEYKRALISNFEYKLDDFKIILYKINYPKKFLTVTHRNILGTLMSIGIHRNAIGDIICQDDIYIVSSKEISKHIEIEFNNINHHFIKLERVEHINYRVIDEYNYENIISSSYRLDSILAKAYNFSRQDAHEYVVSKNIKVNAKIIDNPSHILKINDIVSVKGKGRLKLFEALGMTKSNKYLIKIGKLR